jgi:hypothetical protein
MSPAGTATAVASELPFTRVAVAAVAVPDVDEDEDVALVDVVFLEEVDVTTSTVPSTPPTGSLAPGALYVAFC